jgi:hypothetical protein
MATSEMVRIMENINDKIALFLNSLKNMKIPPNINEADIRSRFKMLKERK